MTRTLVKKRFALFAGFVLPLAAFAQSGAPSFTAKDSVVTFASKQYHPNSFLRNLFMGSNYRKEWEQEVKVPVFHFSGSGFIVKDLGGGLQTKSLHLVDSSGKEWALRTVEKYITNASISPAMRNRLGRNLSQDLISAAFPYAAPLAGQLAHVAGINAAASPVFFVADDSALGKYRSVFAGSLCTLEERDPGFDSTINSAKMYSSLRHSNAYKMQQPVYLSARLLDMLMADWDRHADNWRWALKDSAGFTFIYTIDRDRDWAFYYSKGWIPKLAQIAGAMRCLIPFTRKPKNIKTLSWKAWKLDESFLNELDAAAWKECIHRFQAALTDDAIEEAVKVLPASIYEMDGETFIRKLKSRRDGLEKAVMKYYRFLAENVVINGSDEEEKFVVTSNDEGLRITVYRNNGKAEKLYERNFSPRETVTITLNGLGGADVFQIDEKAKSKIKVKLVGGEGTDSYDIKGSVRTSILDTKEGSSVLHEGDAKFVWLKEQPSSQMPDKTGAKEGNR